jgi:hypothetical protein
MPMSMLPVPLQSGPTTTATATTSVQPKPIISKPATASPQQPPLGTFGAIAAVPVAPLQHSISAANDRSSSPHNVSSSSAIAKPVVATAMPVAKPSQQSSLTPAPAAPATVSSVLPAMNTPAQATGSQWSNPLSSSSAAPSTSSASAIKSGDQPAKGMLHTQ